MAELLCAVCLYDESGGVAKDADTVIEGYAVCIDHLGFVAQGVRFAGIIETARREATAVATTDSDDSEPPGRA